ncbi:MAG: DUF4212 domain-containing protein [Cyanobacteria bacterium J06621_8]
MLEPSEKYSSGEQPEDSELRTQRQRAYWKANIKLIRNLLIIWGVVSLGCSILLVPLLNNFNFARLPLGFWMAQQGSIFTFVILVFIYAIRMDQLEEKYRRKQAIKSKKL